MSAPVYGWEAGQKTIVIDAGIASEKNWRLSGKRGLSIM
jgi:hypothetical protein